MQTQAQANAGFRLLFERASVGIISVGADGRAVEANPAIGRMLGYPPDELVGMSLAEFTHPEDVDGSKRLYEDLLENKRSSYQFEKRFGKINANVINPETGERPIPTFGQYGYKNNLGNSNFHSLQVSLQRHLTSGWLWGTQYMWSHGLADEGFGAGDTIGVQNVLRLPCALQHRH